jgi:16S rRNA (guanine966-N2)-methyltransferase
MKDRVREALFNLLGPAVKGTFAIDLFGGTGALALEALSRGASGAVIIERHFPTARIVRENIATLGVEDLVSVVTADSFHWVRREPELPDQPWVVFCSPPYQFFSQRQEEMLAMIDQLVARAPNGSLFAVEATHEFDFGQLPHAALWDVRTYSPAVLGVMSVQLPLREPPSAGSAG